MQDSLRYMYRLNQIRTYMTVYLVIVLPNIPYLCLWCFPTYIRKSSNPGIIPTRQAKLSTLISLSRAPQLSSLVLLQKNHIKCKKTSHNSSTGIHTHTHTHIHTHTHTRTHTHTHTYTHSFGAKQIYTLLRKYIHAHHKRHLVGQVVLSNDEEAVGGRGSLVLITPGFSMRAYVCVCVRVCLCVCVCVAPLS